MFRPLGPFAFQSRRRVPTRPVLVKNFARFSRFLLLEIGPSQAESTPALVVVRWSSLMTSFVIWVRSASPATGYDELFSALQTLSDGHHGVTFTESNPMNSRSETT